jgi:hypothetical protein
MTTRSPPHRNMAPRARIPRWCTKTGACAREDRSTPVERPDGRRQTWPCDPSGDRPHLSMSWLAKKIIIAKRSLIPENRSTIFYYPQNGSHWKPREDGSLSLARHLWP